MEVSGTAGNLITLSNSSGTTVANLTTSSSQISNDYLNIAYINVTPANVWYAGAHSNNTGGSDTNWIFKAPPIPNQQAPRDANQVPARLGCLNTNGITTIRILGTSGVANCVYVTNQSSTVSTVARKDDNEVNSMLLTSSVDGTAMALSADSNGNILFKSV